MERLTEFPALENRRAYLEHALYTATQQAEALAYEGKADTGVQQWIAGNAAELRELRYALAMLYRQGDSRIELPGGVAVLGMMVLAIVIALQLMILIGLP